MNGVEAVIWFILGNNKEKEVFSMSHFPDERILTQHFLGALLITASVWTGPFLNSPGLELTACTVTAVCLWNGDRI